MKQLILLWEKMNVKERISLRNKICSEICIDKQTFYGYISKKYCPPLKEEKINKILENEYLAN